MKNLFLSLVLFCSLFSYAQIPNIIPYQGHISNNNDKPFDGNFAFEFEIKSASGTSLWSSGSINLSVLKGAYTINLGESPQPALPTNLWSNDILELEISFNDGDNGQETLSPNVQILPVPFAIRAAIADSVSNMNGQLGWGDSLVLRDVGGDIRFVMNPNTGTLKFLKNDTIWQQTSINSPSENVTVSPNGTRVSTSYKKQSDGSVYINRYIERPDGNRTIHSDLVEKGTASWYDIKSQTFFCQNITARIEHVKSWVYSNADRPNFNPPLLKGINIVETWYDCSNSANQKLSSKSMNPDYNFEDYSNGLKSHEGIFDGFKYWVHNVISGGDTFQLLVDPVSGRMIHSNEFMEHTRKMEKGSSVEADYDKATKKEIKTTKNPETYTTKQENQDNYIYIPQGNEQRFSAILGNGDTLFWYIDTFGFNFGGPVAVNAFTSEGITFKKDGVVVSNTTVYSDGTKTFTTNGTDTAWAIFGEVPNKGYEMRLKGAEIFTLEGDSVERLIWWGTDLYGNQRMTVAVIGPKKDSIKQVYTPDFGHWETEGIINQSTLWNESSSPDYTEIFVRDSSGTKDSLWAIFNPQQKSIKSNSQKFTLGADQKAIAELELLDFFEGGTEKHAFNLGLIDSLSGKAINNKFRMDLGHWDTEGVNRQTFKWTDPTKAEYLQIFEYENNNDPIEIRESRNPKDGVLAFKGVNRLLYDERDLVYTTQIDTNKLTTTIENKTGEKVEKTIDLDGTIIYDGYNRFINKTGANGLSTIYTRSADSLSFTYIPEDKLVIRSGISDMFTSTGTKPFFQLFEGTSDDIGVLYDANNSRINIRSNQFEMQLENSLVAFQNDPNSNETIIANIDTATNDATGILLSTDGVVGINRLSTAGPKGAVLMVDTLITNMIGNNPPGGTNPSIMVDASTTINGNLNVNGNVSKLGGSFKIDHPQDPYNKYLVHSFVESPDMMNVYNGNITTNKKGEATVELPTYFEALNMDYRYQLTCIGQFAQAIIYQEIEDNVFMIKTNKPNIKVSWQVTGVRDDSYAAENRLEVEMEKEDEVKGKLLYTPKNN